MSSEAVPALPTQDRRRAGLAAALAGILGIVSFAFLTTALVTRFQNDDPNLPDLEAVQEGPWTAWFRAQDVAVALQALLMIPVTLAMRSAQGTSSGRGRGAAIIGMAGHAGVVLSVALVLAFRAHWADVLYMFPQGLIGIWLIAVCWSGSGLSNAHRVFGVIAGLGLALIAASAAVMQNSLGWHELDVTTRPAVDVAAIHSSGNELGHDLLPFGTLLGRVIYPLWTIVLGWKLLRHSRLDPHVEIRTTDGVPSGPTLQKT